MITSAPVARSAAIVSSYRASSFGPSKLGRSASLPPAAKLTSSGFMARASGSCSSTTLWNSRPRMARFA
jgi:hypothetical protein